MKYFAVVLNVPFGIPVRSGAMSFHQAAVRHHQRTIANAHDGRALAGRRGDPCPQGSIVVFAHRGHDHVIGAVGKTRIEFIDAGLRLKPQRRAHVQYAGMRRHGDGLRRTQPRENAAGNDKIDEFGAAVRTAVFADHSDQCAGATKARVVRIDLVGLIPVSHGGCRGMDLAKSRAVA